MTAGGGELGGEKYRVLYVHDSTLAQAMVRALENESIEPIQADSPSDALKRLDSESIDVLIVPESSEEEWFVDGVRRIRPDIPIVVFGQSGEPRPDVTSIPKDEFGRTLLETIEGILTDRRIEAALDSRDRLERVAFDVAHAAVTGEDEQSILQTVYDRFDDVNLFEFVWVTRYDSSSGELVGLRPFRGRFSPADLGSMLGDENSTFVSDALESTSLAIGHGFVETRSTASTQQTDQPAFEPPGTRFAAVPFASDGQIRGLAIFGSDRPDAFDSSEQAILGELGEMVGAGLRSITEDGPAQSTPERVKQLVEVIAHEIRNPLQIASSYLEIGREHGDDQAFERVAEAQSTIEEILNAVLVMAESGGIDDTEMVDVTDLAADVWSDIGRESAALEIGESVTIEADPDLLTRLLTNLLSNAIDHGGPAVTVRIGPLSDATGFFVEDDGPGIPADQRETVFRWGYSTEDEGLGIGLGFVKEIAEAHGWTVSVAESESGGARFTIKTDNREVTADGGKLHPASLERESEASDDDFPSAVPS